MTFLQLGSANLAKMLGKEYKLQSTKIDNDWLTPLQGRTKITDTAKRTKRKMLLETSESDNDTHHCNLKAPQNADIRAFSWNEWTMSTACDEEKKCFMSIANSLGRRNEEIDVDVA